MYCLTICFGPANTPWALMFKTQEAAEAALHKSVAPGLKIIIEDDFGQRAYFSTTAIHGLMLEDLSLSKLAHIERALHQARMQAEGQKMAQTDPALMHAARGPNIISPMMGGNGRFPT